MIEHCMDTREKGNGTRAVILIGHGSRAAGADDAMERIAERLRSSVHGIVVVCRMSGRGTPFAEVFENCVRQGSKEIIVIPYFLHFGVHLRQDIPEILREAAGRHPGVRLILGKHLGYDDTLVSLVEKRLGESEAVCDIRQLQPMPIDRYPGKTNGESRRQDGRTTITDIGNRPTPQTAAEKEERTRGERL
jgi:sirohydrochlorin ferrochelatase